MCVCVNFCWTGNVYCFPHPHPTRREHPTHRRPSPADVGRASGHRGVTNKQLCGCARRGAEGGERVHHVAETKRERDTYFHRQGCVILPHRHDCFLIARREEWSLSLRVVYECGTNVYRSDPMKKRPPIFPSASSNNEKGCPPLPAQLAQRTSRPLLSYSNIAI